LPVIADADTGFGEGEMCAKTVYEYFNAGASGKKENNKKKNFIEKFDQK
jgi:2-methylisocitrate lyase-like PEP mutase family enzyme